MPPASKNGPAAPANAEKKFNCPIEVTLDVIGGRWKALILWHLRDGKHRTGELRRRIPHISEKMLIQQLRQLEDAGVVERTVSPRGAASGGVRPDRARPLARAGAGGDVRLGRPPAGLASR